MAMSLILFIIVQALEHQPTWKDSLFAEFIKTVPNAVLALLGAILALLVGGSITMYWAVRQKQREIELSALNDFYRLYGEFFAIWKLWNVHFESKSSLQSSKEQTWRLFERAASLEAGAEALWVKIACEKPLKKPDLDNLGLLRQAFRVLRVHIDEDYKLDWWHSDHRQYVVFKETAAHVSRMLLSNRPFLKPKPEVATKQLLEITHNRHETRWMDLAGEELVLYIKGKIVNKGPWHQGSERTLWQLVNRKAEDIPDWLTNRIISRLQNLARDSDGWICGASKEAIKFVSSRDWNEMSSESERARNETAAN